MNHWTTNHEENGIWIANCACGWTETADTRYDAIQVSKAHKAEAPAEAPIAQPESQPVQPAPVFGPPRSAVPDGAVIVLYNGLELEVPSRNGNPISEHVRVAKEKAFKAEMEMRKAEHRAREAEIMGKASYEGDDKSPEDYWEAWVMTLAPAEQSRQRHNRQMALAGVDPWNADVPAECVTPGNCQCFTVIGYDEPPF